MPKKYNDAGETSHMKPRYIDANILIDLATHEGAYGYVDVHDIYNAHTADVVERKKGKWIKMSDADGIYYACSECGKDIPRVPDFNPQFDLFPRLKSLEKTNFCPECGADMRNVPDIDNENEKHD